MKLEKITHDHLLTKWLKVIIFAILMLAPIFSVAIRCAYVVCNKNAYQSYSDSAIQNTTKVINENTEIVGQTYLISYNDSLTISGTSTPIYFTSCTADFTQFTGVNFNVIGYRIYSQSTYIYLYDESNAQHNISTTQEQIKNVLNGQTFVYESGSMHNGGYEWYFDYYLITYKNHSLDNVFDYSVAQLKQDQLFNWTQNTGVYTGVNAMCTGLGLTDGTIAILITYWTLLSIIYVIIDIVLEGFVALTHMILKKAS